MFPNFAYVAGA